MLRKSPETQQIIAAAAQVNQLDLPIDTPSDYFDVALPETMHEHFGQKAPHIVATKLESFVQIDVIGEPLPGIRDRKPVRSYYVFPKAQGFNDEIRVKDTLLINDRRQPHPDTLKAPAAEVENIHAILGNILLNTALETEASSALTD